MVGIIFDYSVRVRRIFWIGEGKDRHEELEGNWNSFGNVFDAIQFCAKNPAKSLNTTKVDWIIELTLHGQVLERLDPYQWKVLAGLQHATTICGYCKHEFPDGIDGKYAERCPKCNRRIR